MVFDDRRECESMVVSRPHTLKTKQTLSVMGKKHTTVITGTACMNKDLNLYFRILPVFASLAMDLPVCSILTRPRIRVDSRHVFMYVCMRACV